MDETRSNRSSSDAAASRKRRSSILKNQRAPRTPFSELEFNVATPPDVTKSRRVSFSRRTGVAEFVKNEGTTTWTNFYEEHNKSLESSGNESGANAARPSISHIGKRIFDQQFEEVEAVDFGCALIQENSRVAEFNMSINNINLTQQLVALECIDKKLDPPKQNFELSSLTNHQSKVFCDDFTLPVMSEISNQINLNFSVMKPIGKSDNQCDDLDEIQKDLERSHNIVCPGPFREQNISEYIEVDLNMTHVAVANEESDMSITDMIHSPKVQEVSSSISSSKPSKPVIDKDWITDKENIAVLNPYIAPRETDNFVINEVPDKILVFDGKRLTVQSEKKEALVGDKEIIKELSDTLLDNVPQRKTIVLNMNDDLPNFKDEHVLMEHRDILSGDARDLKHTMIYEDRDLSITQAVPNIIEPSNAVEMINKRKTISSENNASSISFTQAIPTNIILDHESILEKGKTILYDNSFGNISMTQAISANILLDNNRDLINKKQSTTLFENQSFAKVVPTNSIELESNEKNGSKTILFQNYKEDKLFSKTLANNMLLEKSNINTSVFERSLDNLSITQVLPSNIILIGNEGILNDRKTIVFENDDANISMTQAIPKNLILTGKSQDNECTNSFANISITQAIPDNLILIGKSQENECTNSFANISMTQAIPNNLILIGKSQDNECKNIVRTDVFENDPGNVSLNQVQSTKLIQEVSNKSVLDIGSHKLIENSLAEDPKGDKNVALSDTLVNIHRSESLPNKKLIVTYNDNENIAMTQGLSTNVLPLNHLTTPVQQKCFVIDKKFSEISSAKPVPSDMLLKEENNEISPSQISEISILPVKGIIVDNIASVNNKSVNEHKHAISCNAKHVIDIKDTENKEIGNLSKAKPIPNKIVEIKNEILKAGLEKVNNLIQFGGEMIYRDTVNDKCNIDVLVYQAKVRDTSETNAANCSELQDEKIKPPVEIGKTNSTIANDINNISTICNKSEDLKETDFENRKSVQEITNKYSPAASNLEILEMSNHTSQDIKEKKSILHDLLDMSSSSLVDNIVDKTTKISMGALAQNTITKSESNSNEAIFIITGDTDEKSQTDTKIVSNHLSTADIINVDKLKTLENTMIPAYERNLEEENSLENRLIELRRSVNDEEKKNQPQNRHYEKIISSDLQESFKQSNMDKSNVKDAKTWKSFKEADDTKELLEMLSDFTDRKSVCSTQDDSEEVSKIKHRKSMILDCKPEIPEPKRLSFAPKRQSIVLTREELLNNLSMAQATLQQSRFELEETDDITTDSPTKLNESISSPKKTVRMSNEVVKTLHFEDESCSNASLKSDIKMSPLKKTAFGETSYMKDCKVNVIPTYLKDVTDNMKALMNDLVKPRPDQMPFEVTAIPKTKTETSTCSTQIQANLITSSQIDLDLELHSNVNSVCELNKTESLMTDITNMRNSESVKSHKEPARVVFDDTQLNEENKSYVLKYNEENFLLKQSSQEPVLVFDRHNPLNNILLAPSNCLEVHKYNPEKSLEALCIEDNLMDSKKVTEMEKDNHCDVELLLTQYNVESYVGLQSGDARLEKNGDSNSLSSHPSKPLSIDRSTEGCAMEVKNTEVNTVIVMKGNKELLEASSSLTLVDDALANCVFDIKVENRREDRNSPVKVIYKIDDEEATLLDKVDSDLVSNNDEPMEYCKAKKRSYSPSRSDLTRPLTVSSPDVTPKPLSKMQKISNSPINVTDGQRSASEDDNLEKTEPHKKRSSRKSKSFKYTKPGTDVTVQQLITEYKITKMEQDMIEEQIIEAIHDRMSSNGLDIDKLRDRSPDAVSSCTSSKGEKGMREAYLKDTVSYIGSQPSKVDWQPDLMELSSKSLLSECESGVNVVAKIDMLPFMGSKECEWETSGGDTWVFRLLRARLRMRVRLAHRHHNALRTRVRADTPVVEISVDAVPVEEKDPLAELCVRFAAEAMRYECGRGCARAGDVPLALRRCGGVARVALRWARAMRDARTRLAYTLKKDGVLSLKVANIPLRSVWEVSMRLELVVEDAREAAWPRAADVRVHCVLSDCAVPAAEAARALQPLHHDWGHAPRAIWKIFRYLKNKTREDDFLRLRPERAATCRADVL